MTDALLTGTGACWPCDDHGGEHPELSPKLDGAGCRRDRRDESVRRRYNPARA